LHLSGCGADIAPNVPDLCSATITVAGPKPVIGELCSSNSLLYELYANGTNLSDPANKANWVCTWSVSGDLAMDSSPNDQVLIVHATAESGSGTITARAPADGECKTEEGSFKTLIAEQIAIIPNKLTIGYSPSTCIDVKTGTASGLFSVDDLYLKNFPKDNAVYLWSVTPVGAATASKLQGLLFNEIQVVNINADFTLTVTRVGDKCTKTTTSKFFMLSSFTSCP
jgi:hypothetical protein